MRRKFRNRHKLKLSDTIGLNDIKIKQSLIAGISKAFPDVKNQQKYIKALYNGLA